MICLPGVDVDVLVADLGHPRAGHGVGHLHEDGLVDLVREVVPGTPARPQRRGQGPRGEGGGQTEPGRLLGKYWAENFGAEPMGAGGRCMPGVAGCGPCGRAGRGAHHPRGGVLPRPFARPSAPRALTRASTTAATARRGAIGEPLTSLRVTLRGRPAGSCGKRWSPSRTGASRSATLRGSSSVMTSAGRLPWPLPIWPQVF